MNVQQTVELPICSANLPLPFPNPPVTIIIIIVVVKIWQRCFPYKYTCTSVVFKNHLLATAQTNV